MLRKFEDWSQLYGAIPALAPDEQARLLALNPKPKKVINKLVRHNMGLVFQLTHALIQDPRLYEDAIQMGSIGLYKAIEKYNPSMGAQLSTYAYHWISQYIKRVRQCDTSIITVPGYMHMRLYRIHQCRRALFNRLGDWPSNQAVAQVLGLQTAMVDEALMIEQRYLKAGLISLDEPLPNTDDSSGVTYQDTIACHDHADLVFFWQEIEKHREIFLENYMSRRKSARAAQMRQRTAVILEQFFRPDKPTLQELADIHGVTRERIRQITSRFLRYLKKTDIKAWRYAIYNA